MNATLERNVGISAANIDIFWKFAELKSRVTVPLSQTDLYEDQFTSSKLINPLKHEEKERVWKNNKRCEEKITGRSKRQFGGGGSLKR
jgi:hypothetical protein